MLFVMYFLTLCFFLIFNFLYIKIWRTYLNKVPTGIGFFLFFPLLIFYLYSNLPITSIIITFFLSLIYFLDDLIELNFLNRILLQIFASLVIYLTFDFEINLIIILINLVLFVILVNTLNFQDGQDLNIAILLILVFCIFYFNAENKFIQNTSVIIIFFLIAFSFFNFKKKTLYFGDSGCYFISIIFFLFLYKEINNTTLIKLLIAVIAFPIIDVFYVIIFRILKKQNLLSRNYLHLYQILAQKINSKFYLLPNILFSAVNIFVSSYFYLGINFIIFLSILNILLLLVTRRAIKKLFH